VRSICMLLPTQLCKYCSCSAFGPTISSEYLAASRQYLPHLNDVQEWYGGDEEVIDSNTGRYVCLELSAVKCSWRHIQHPCEEIRGQSYPVRANRGLHETLEIEFDV
jgi:hypothetical protein